MKLGDRIKDGGDRSGGPVPLRALSTRNGNSTGRPPTEAEPGPKDFDPLATLKLRAQEALFSRLGNRLYDASLSQDQLEALVLEELATVIEGEPVPLTPDERDQLVTAVSRDVLGYGPIEEFLVEESVSEIMVNQLNPIYVERSGRIEATDRRFLSDEHLRRVIERIVSEIGRHIDESAPMVDARLPDGSRVNAIIPPLAVDGPVLTIRKFASTPFTIDDLTTFGSVTPATAEFLGACIKGRITVLVSGGTGAGKTTFLNVLSSFIPEDERIVTIEDAVELQLDQDHVIRLERRPPNIEGKGEVSTRDLVRNALRMRPDRIVIGEVRGAEALDMLQAMNTGHEGSLSTLHANSPRDALSRLETMVLMAGMDLPIRAIREQAASAIDLIVHLARLSDGTRRIIEITEVEAMEGDIVTLNKLHQFDFTAGRDTDGRFLGVEQPTGLRPKFADRLADFGVELRAELFSTVPASSRGTADGRANGGKARKK